MFSIIVICLTPSRKTISTRMLKYFMRRPIYRKSSNVVLTVLYVFISAFIVMFCYYILDDVLWYTNSSFIYYLLNVVLQFFSRQIFDSFGALSKVDSRTVTCAVSVLLCSTRETYSFVPRLPFRRLFVEPKPISHFSVWYSFISDD